MGYYRGEFIIYSETSEYLVTRVMRMVPDDRRRGQTRVRKQRSALCDSSPNSRATSYRFILIY